MTSLWQQVRSFCGTFQNALVAWAFIAVFAFLGFYYGLNHNVIGAVVLLIGILGQAFGALIAWIGFVPLVGPLIAKVLALPFIWLINGIGYLVSIVAIKRGYSKDVINYRLITVALIVGITLGYILGKLI